MNDAATLHDALDTLNPTGERIACLGSCRVCHVTTRAGQLLCHEHAFAIVEAALCEVPPPGPATDCPRCGGDRVVWVFPDPAGRPLRADCPTCVPGDQGPGTVPARWHWLMQELERRLPDPEPYRSDRGPEEWYMAQLDGLLARLRRAEYSLQAVALNATNTAQAFRDVQDKDEYRRGQVRGAEDAARAAVRYLTGSGALQPPEDHAEFVAVRARGFAALRRGLERRRRALEAKRMATWCWEHPPREDEPSEEYVTRVLTDLASMGD